MTSRHGFVILLAVVWGVGAAQGQATSAQQPAKAAPNPFLRILAPGQWWTSLPQDTKETFIDGYTTGMAHAYMYAHGVCMTEKDKLKPGPQFEAQMKAVIGRCFLAELLDFDVDKRQLQAGLDELYKDTQNTRIPVSHALEYARDKLKGKKSPQELDDNLTEWRRIMSR